MESPPLTAERETTLRDYLDLFLARWWLLAAAVAAGLVTALAVSMLTPRVYRGTATVVVDRTGLWSGQLAENGPFGLLGGQGGADTVETLTEIVKSRAVAEKAIDRLGDPPAQRDAALRDLQAGLQVQRVRNADIIRIQAEGSTPAAAAVAANAVAEAFIGWNLDARRAQATAGRVFIEGQLENVGRELRASEDALAQYEARGGQVALSEQTKLAITKLADFEAQRRAASVEAQAVEASLSGARSALNQQAPTVPASFQVADDPVASHLRQQLASLEVDLAGLKEQFTDRSPQVIATKAQIEEVKARLRQLTAQRTASQTVTLNPLQQDLAAQIIKLQVEREALRARESALGATVRRYTLDTRRFPATEISLARLTRDVKVAEGTYLLLSQKLQEARIAEASIVGDLRIVDRAVPSGVPVRPRTGMNTLFGALLGLMLGVAGVFVLEALDTTFKTPQEAGEYLGLPVLATVPLWRGAPAGTGQIPLVIGEHRWLPLAEAFRHLRTSLLYCSPDRPLRTLQITSAVPGEGKSFVAANLAIAMSEMDRKVWLMECDLRRPHLALAFRPETDHGLSELLVDELGLEQVLHQTPIANLRLMPGGRTPPNPAELLGSRKMRAFLSGELEGADFVVLDAPPVLPVTDAAVLAPAVDGVLFVVDLRRTPREAARRARQQLEAVGARVVGVVVNGLTSARSGYYHYSNYYSGYPARSRPAAADSGQ